MKLSFRSPVESCGPFVFWDTDDLHHHQNGFGSIMKRVAHGWLGLLLVLMCFQEAAPGQPAPGQVTSDDRAPAIQQPRMEANGTFRFQLFGQLGDNLTIQSSGDLVTWNTLETLVITNIPMEISDPDAKNFSTHFYRVIPGDSTDGSAGLGQVDGTASPGKGTVGDPMHNSALFSRSAPTFNPLVGSPFEADPPFPGVHFYGGTIPRLRARLSRIVLPEFSSSGRSLNDILVSLGRQSRQLDPDGRGANFVIDRSNLNSSYTSSPTVIDTVTGLPVPSDPGDIPITVPRLRNVSLGEILDTIVKSAPRPIQYSILDYAVVFSSTPRNPEPRFSRRFKVDPVKFIESLESIAGPIFSLPEPPLLPGQPRMIGTNEAPMFHAAFQQFFAMAGVDLQPPKCAFYKDRDGLLLVHATQADMDLIEAVLPLVNVQY